MNTKSWLEVAGKISAIHFNESFDLIVAIANGGIIPAALINQRLLLPIELLKLSFRDGINKKWTERHFWSGVLPIEKSQQLK